MLQQRPRSSANIIADRMAKLPERDPAEVELERKVALLQRARVVRENARAMRGSIQGMKPDLVYIWVNIREERQIYFQNLGYELCKDPEVVSKWKRDDGAHRRGDLILYQVPKDLHEALKLDSEIRAIEDMENSKDGFLAFAERLSIPTYHPEERR